MHNQSLRDERPYIRPFHTSLSFPLIAIAAGITAAAVYAYFALYSSLTPPQMEAPALSAPVAAAPEPKPAPVVSTAPDVPAMPSLPSLDNSDGLMREKLVDLMGRVPFAELVLPAALVRRIVATIDNLPRETAPRRVIPLAPVPGSFAVRGDAGRMVLDAGNFARYAPYVRVIESIDEKALVTDYARAYPLFQQAYEELGFPGKQFNDRLLAAIDDLLATPEIDAPVELMRPRVHYEFASPDLETRSAGQKILLRIGPENAARVKAKLLLVRREIIAASKPR
jgi:hypothetical protein